MTENELRAISDYISYNTEGGLQAPIDTILSPWTKAKAHLLSLFGDKLILEKEVEYAEPTETIRNRISSDLLYYHSPYSEMADRFTKAFVEAISQYNTDLSPWLHYDRLVSYIFTADTLASNSYELPYSFDFDKVELAISDSKKIQFINGAKPLRLATKLLDLVSDYDKVLFEEFRIKLSQITNKRNLKGTLCLSIHPLDYMTMSDNNSNWSSCMSWTGEGCYRAGTVEMMNSPIVVVGYLKSEAFDYKINNDFKWNSKRWRSLFIVDDDIICSIKGYPYQSKDLSVACLDWLRDLTVSQNELKPVFPDNLESFSSCFFKNYHFETNAMYNDFGTTTHYCYAKDVDTDTFINYSGVRECMSCGNIYGTFDNCCDEPERLLSCDNCWEGEEDHYYCENCGDRIYDEEVIWCGDSPYCSCCADRYLAFDESDGNYYPNDEMITLFVPYYYIERYNWNTTTFDTKLCKNAVVHLHEDNVVWEDNEHILHCGKKFTYNDETGYFEYPITETLSAKDFNQKLFCCYSGLNKEV